MEMQVSDNLELPTFLEGRQCSIYIRYNSEAGALFLTNSTNESVSSSNVVYECF